jgi:hypothetical protein
MIETPEQHIGRHLDPGERLLWAGQPRQGIVLRGHDVFMIPFSLLWGGMIIVWEVMAFVAVFQSKEPVTLLFPLFGLPFLAIGLYLIFGRFLVDARSRARTFYGITNERIIISSGIFSRNLKSLQLRTLSDVTLSEKSDGRGTISFGQGHFMMAWFPVGWPGAGRHAPPSFELVPDAKRIFDIIRQAQKA